MLIYDIDPAELLKSAFNAFIHHFTVLNVVQVAVILVVIYRVYIYIKGTYAEHLLKGILVIIFAWIMSQVFKLQIISKVLEGLVSIALFSLVVIFQPELRKVLTYLGQRGIMRKGLPKADQEAEAKNIVYIITESVKYLSKSRTGALIVFEDQISLEQYLEVGTKTDADISLEILLTIFHANTPLHDGAVIIKDKKIIGAGVLLPLTEDPNLSWQYGTRHRAAIGISEVSDGVAIIVSEETGRVSVARDGVLTVYENAEEIGKVLEGLYLNEFDPDRKYDKFHEFFMQEIFTFKDNFPFKRLFNKKELKKG